MPMRSMLAPFRGLSGASGRLLASLVSDVAPNSREVACRTPLIHLSAVEELWARASVQLGLVTERQALSVMSVRTLKRCVARGELIRVRQGVYRVAGVPPSRW